MLVAITFFAAVLLTVSCKKDDDIELPPIGGYDSSDDIAATNLIAKFSFEDNVDDVQGNTTGGTSTNTSFVDGVKGKAWQGSTDGYTVYDTPGASLTGVQSITVAFWVNTTVHSDGAEALFMLTNENSWIGNLFIIQESGVAGKDSIRFKVKFDNWDAAAWKEQWIDFSGKQMLAGLSDTWAHLAFSYDGATSKFYMYLDGVKLVLPEDFINRYEDDPAAGGGPFGNLKFDGVTKFVFGAYQNMVGVGAAPDAWMKNFDGKLDEFRIYNKALIDTDIKALFDLETAGR